MNKSKKYNDVPEVQLVLVEKTKTNEDLLHELLHKLNLACSQIMIKQSK